MNYVVVVAGEKKDLVGTVLSHTDVCSSDLKERLDKFRLNGQIAYEGTNEQEARKILSRLKPLSSLPQSELEKWLKFYFNMSGL